MPEPERSRQSDRKPNHRKTAAASRVGKGIRKRHAFAESSVGRSRLNFEESAWPCKAATRRRRHAIAKAVPPAQAIRRRSFAAEAV